MPKRKVVVGAVAGAVVTLGLFILQVADPAVSRQVTPVEAGAGVTIVSTILAFLIPEADQA